MLWVSETKEVDFHHVIRCEPELGDEKDEYPCEVDGEYVSASFSNLWDLAKLELNNPNEFWFKLLDPVQKVEVGQIWRDHSGRRAEIDNIFEVLTPDGEMVTVRLISISKKPVYYELGRFIDSWNYCGPDA
jgi:hypothetical protein